MIQVELGPELEAALSADARARQLSLDEHLRDVVGRTKLLSVEQTYHSDPPSAPENHSYLLTSDLDAEERNRNASIWLAEAQELSKGLPKLPDAAYERASFYDETQR